MTIVAAAGAAFDARGQITASGDGRVTGTVTGKNLPPNPQVSDITSVDFRNLTYPNPLAVAGGAVLTLKNGISSGAKPNPLMTFKLRKTYFFDLTGDGREEAVTHILADSCGEGCDSHSLFFIHTVENKELKLLWQFATGAEALGGLKSINFDEDTITVETFGRCAMKNALVTAEYDGKKPKQVIPVNYTRFEFRRGDSGFLPFSQEVLPFTEKTIAGYRAQISFGTQN